MQAYTTLTYTAQVYAGPPEKANSKNASPVTPLSGRTFGTWTMITAIVRFYAAYHLDDNSWYDLATWTFVVRFHCFLNPTVLSFVQDTRELMIPLDRCDTFLRGMALLSNDEVEQGSCRTYHCGYDKSAVDVVAEEQLREVIRFHHVSRADMFKNQRLMSLRRRRSVQTF
jgi:hypothetical protein